MAQKTPLASGHPFPTLSSPKDWTLKIKGGGGSCLTRSNQIRKEERLTPDGQELYPGLSGRLDEDSEQVLGNLGRKGCLKLSLARRVASFHRGVDR